MVHGSVPCMPHPLRNSGESQVKKEATKLKTSWEMKRYVNLVQVDNFCELQPRTALLIGSRVLFMRRGGGLSMERVIFSIFKGTIFPHILPLCAVFAINGADRKMRCHDMLTQSKCSVVDLPIKGVLHIIINQPRHRSSSTRVVPFSDYA